MEVDLDAPEELFWAQLEIARANGDHAFASRATDRAVAAALTRATHLVDAKLRATYRQSWPRPEIVAAAVTLGRPVPPELA